MASDRWDRVRSEAEVVVFGGMRTATVFSPRVDRIEDGIVPNSYDVLHHLERPVTTAHFSHCGASEVCTLVSVER